MKGGDNPDIQQTPDGALVNNLEVTSIDEQRQTIQTAKQDRNAIQVESINNQSGGEKISSAPETTTITEKSGTTSQIFSEKTDRKPEAGISTQKTDQSTSQNAKKERKSIKLLRMLIWFIIAITLPVGVSLRTRSESIESFADGTAPLKLSVGNNIFYIAVIVGGLNLVWGVIRWIRRIKCSHCSAGRVIGKLIGGGIWRTAVFVPIISFSLIFVSTLVNGWVEEKYYADKTARITSNELIEKDYKSGAISTDAYVRNLLYDTFDRSALPEEYQGRASYSVPDIANLVSTHFDDLSDETLLLFYQAYMLPNIQFGIDAANNQIAYEDFSFSDNAYAAIGTTQTTTLNKAKLCQSGRFVLIYTDTGYERISESEAQEVCDIIEETVAEAEQLGISYDYEKTEQKEQSESFNAMLRSNGIQENILDSAFPFYITSPWGTDKARKKNENVIAYHAGAKLNDIFEQIAIRGVSLFDQQSDFATQLPSYPYMVIPPHSTLRDSEHDSDNARFIIAHEFAHHLEERYRFHKFGKYGFELGEEFINEALAQLMSININKNRQKNNILFDHYIDYINNYSSPIDQIEPVGYTAIAFFENLYELSGYDMEKMFELFRDKDTLIESTSFSDQISALEEIEEVFGVETMKQALAKTAERMLTGTYDEELVLSRDHEMPVLSVFDCDISCNRSGSIPYSSSLTALIEKPALMQVNPKYHRTIKAYPKDDQGAANSKLTFTVLGKESDGSWVVAYSATDNRIEFDINTDSVYSAYCIIITNYDINKSGDDEQTKCTIETLDWFDEEKPPFEISVESNIYGDCYSFDVKKILNSDIIDAFMGGDKILFKNNLGISDGIDTVNKQLSNMPNFYAKMCTHLNTVPYPDGRRVYFDSQKQLFEQLGATKTFTLFDKTEDGVRSTVILGINYSMTDISQVSAKLYYMGQNQFGKDADITINTISISQKPE